ncbi:MAG: hypothetical protein IPK82_34960 [Polyangiaceae bacterium]|nr:hypothetical protein [Polyangiaceae bacterium]
MRITGIEIPPPSCLASVRVTRAEGDFRQKLIEQFVSDVDDAESLERHRKLERTEEWLSTRDELEVWRVGCPCGDEKGKIFGVGVDQEFSAPVFYGCTKCAARGLIFDPSLHGYNAETAKKKKKVRAAPPAKAALHCRGCKTTVWRPAVVVTYQGEPPNIAPGRGLQDYFDAILIGGQCIGCSNFALRYSAECA